MDRRPIAWRRVGRELGRALFDLVLPPVCAACRGALDGDDGLCATCRRQLAPTPTADACPRCGAPRAGGVCRQDHARLQNVRRLIAPLRFAGTGGQLVRRFKLDGDATAGRLLARAVVERLRADLAPEVGRRAVLVPVPLHRARRRRRGFDQAAWLARRIGRRLGWRVATGVLVRRRATSPQGDPRVRSRTQNVRGAFALRAPNPLSGRPVVLVDDVFTSGATARECARLLRRAGASCVFLAVACRS